MLQKLQNFNGPVALLIMDGVGLNDKAEGNAVKNANTPVLDMLMEKYPNLAIAAHGTSVGLPSDDDMGNSEVGHNAMGAGKVYSQGAKLVTQSIEEGSIFEREAWREISDNCLVHSSTLHFIGLFSDGNVHSHIDHLKAMILQAKKEGIRKVRIHILLDGRDVGETSALEYVEPFEEFLASLNNDGFDARIASGGGRMKITMDRYEADWKMVENGWDTHVRGKGRYFATAKEAILAYREENPVIDQDLPPFVIAENGNPIGTVNDNDSVVYFNFRGDRAIEISKAFEYDDFDKFDTSPKPKVVYAGMLQYDGDLHLPKRFLVAPPLIQNTLGENLAKNKISQYAISETQKFGHVTYFWNGNRSGKFDDEMETYKEIVSDRVPFEQRPWMKAAEITDEFINALNSGKYKFLRLNFANGDMVGHTGDYNAAVIAVETLDLCLGRILPVIEKLGGIAIITADHGNADEMYETDKKTGKPAVDKKGKIKAKTSHTLNKVPCIFYDNAGCLKVKTGKFGLSNIASTISVLLGLEPSDQWDESMIEI